MAQKVERTKPTDVLKKATAAGRQASEKAPSRKQSKPSDNYLRVDLTPKGIDLKGYLSERCGQLGKERGRNVSATAYIQELILEDKHYHENSEDSKRKKIEKILDQMNEGQIEALATLLNVQL